MSKHFYFLILISFFSYGHAQQQYTPSQANLEQRKWYSDSRFGLFIHFGLFSILGEGEWVMNDKGISIEDYTPLKDRFNPTSLNVAQYVRLAKGAGMKYITLITRHHDGFSMWDTKYSDFNIMNTPYRKDIVKMFAEECHKQGLKLFLYYSILDWRRSDYSYWTGRTGQRSGRKTQRKWEDYIQFMKNQLTELLSNYGEIAGVWLDGHWDQTNPEGEKDRSSRVNWHYDELYGLIHRLQPQAMVGNNHHLSPIQGEDFQMFERDLPGENKGGLSFQKAGQLPLETCETINKSWGYNAHDNAYKSSSDLIRLLARAAGLGANLLLNIGPKPNGEITAQSINRLAAIGKWMKINGESIYGTTAGYLKPQKWGCITQKPRKIYVHVFQTTSTKIVLPNFPFKKIEKSYFLGNKKDVAVKLIKGTLTIPKISAKDGDTVLVLEEKE